MSVRERASSASGISTNSNCTRNNIFVPRAWSFLRIAIFNALCTCFTRHDFFNFPYIFHCARTFPFLATFLHPPDFGDTDGPIPDECVGRWDVEPGTNNYRMAIRRTFGAGRDSKDSGVMGEFSFDGEFEFGLKMNWCLWTVLRVV